MKQEIKSILKEIENRENVKVLFAIESGSRLWRMASKDSDYDVRGVFIQPIENYLNLSSSKNQEKVINLTEGKVDLQLFDIFKFCKLLAKSNPSMIEWMQSKINYYGKVPAELQMLMYTFDPKALYHHYRSMCERNYKKYINSKKEVTYKKYLYAMRGLVNAKIVESVSELPPIHFDFCLEYLRLHHKSLINDKILLDLEDVIKLKKEGKEKEIIKNKVMYNSFIESFLKEPYPDFELVREIDNKKINLALIKLIKEEK